MEEKTLDEMWRDHDLRFIWTCPKCQDSYEDQPFSNEGLKCSRCHIPHVKTGEIYTA